MKQTQTDKDIIWKEGVKTELLKTVVMNITSVQSSSPDGTKGNYIVADANDWVVIIPVIDDKLLMVRQWRHGEKAISIEFPGGVIEKGEDPETAARRELQEETGYTSENIVSLGKMNPNPALMSNHLYIYAAYQLTRTSAQKLDADEYVQYLEIQKNEVYKKMGTGEYFHALMAAALCLFRNYENK